MKRMLFFCVFVAAPWLILLLCGACRSPAPESSPHTSIRVSVSIVTSKGEAVGGGSVSLGLEKFVTNEAGVVEFDVSSQGTSSQLLVECPKTHQGKHLQRTISPLLLTNGKEMQYSFVCEPHQRTIALALHSECPQVAVWYGGEQVGTTEEGVMYAELNQNLDEGTYRSSSDPIVLIARSLDATCTLKDERLVGEVQGTEVLIEVDESTEAVWASLSAQPRKKVRVRRVGPVSKPKLPYRL